MKISKVFASIAVCGALIFPGVISTSAQELEHSVPPKSINYSAEKEIKLLNYIEVASLASSYTMSKSFEIHQGEKIWHTFTLPDPPFNVRKYSGYLYYEGKYREGWKDWYKYTGTLYWEK